MTPKRSATKIGGLIKRRSDCLLALVRIQFSYESHWRRCVALAYSYDGPLVEIAFAKCVEFNVVLGKSCESVSFLWTEPTWFEFLNSILDENSLA